ncbi:MAG: hypothetical protein IPP46_06130 [Bacteroidetes bacterium]|nr:hypothetical protein [Bacteroidota bacterium]
MVTHDDIFWIIGDRIDQRYRITENTTRVLILNGNLMNTNPFSPGKTLFGKRQAWSVTTPGDDPVSLYCPLQFAESHQSTGLFLLVG